MTIWGRLGAGLTVLLGCLLAGVSPAAAENVTVVDPKGDTDGYDIVRMTGRFKPERLRIELRQSNVPDDYQVRVDVPGGSGYEYVISWSIYGPDRSIEVWKRGYPPGGRLCRRDSAVLAHHNRVLNYHVPHSCLRNPDELRLRAVAVDDQFGPTDRTAWSRWISAG